MHIKQYVNRLSIIMLIFLSGCENKHTKNKNELLNTMKTHYAGDRIEQNSQACFYLGDVTFPYQAKVWTYPEKTKADVWTNNELNRRLALFSQLSLVYKLDATLADSPFDLTEQGKRYFSDNKFCFGQINITDLTFNSSQKATTAATVKYEFENIPDWVNDSAFQAYFYGDNNVNRYPLFNNQPKSLSITLARLKEGTYIINDPSEFIYNLYQLNNKKSLIGPNSLAFAYYDRDLAKELIRDLIKYDYLKYTWGDPDPVLLAKLEMSPNIAQANNIILFLEDIDLVISPNKIKSIEAEVSSKMLASLSRIRSDKTTITISMHEDGSLDRYALLYKSSLGESQTVRVKHQDIAEGTQYWELYQATSVYRASGNQYDPFATTKYTNTSDSVNYHTDQLGKIVSFSAGQQSVPIKTRYDEQNRLVEYEDSKVTYQGQQLIQIDSKTSQINFNYNNRNQLVKSIAYSKEQGKLIKGNTCNYLEYNAQGDWTEYRCSDGNIITRTITYYDE